MKNLIIITALFVGMFANAQNYLIEFTGSGATTTISTIKVENLTSELSITLNGSDILLLTEATGAYSIENGQTPGVNVFPNPITDDFIIQIIPPKAGNAIMTLVDMSGKIIIQKNYYLERNLHEFRFSGVSSGLYLINIKGNNYQYSAKLISTSKLSRNNSIEITPINQFVGEIKFTKNVQTTIEMPYTDGDRLLFTASSDIYSTVKTDIPIEDKTIAFNFIECTDDGNNYPVVEIGAQIWMAENLKTTKYNNGNEIQNVTDVSTWSGISGGAYCWYDNDSTYKNIYGALYNWYAVDDYRKICPSGWHIPTTSEWWSLIDYLGGQMSNVSGNLRETGTTHWSGPNTDATNESGFTARPGGKCYSSFEDIGSKGLWWTATEINTWNAYGKSLESDVNVVINVLGGKPNGFSVRCIRD